MDVSVTSEPGPDWDEFVEAEGGTLGQASGWGHAIRAAYGLECHFLSARESTGEIAGVLPLVRFRGLTGRIELVSMPFLDTGGILARSAGSEQVLLDAALGLARDLGAKAVELRDLARDTLSGPQSRVDLVLDLASSEEAQWSSLPAKVRNQVRKADKEELQIAASVSLDDFYEPFRHNMRDLGSPVHSERFFAAAAEAFGDRWRFVATRLGDRRVGGLAAIHFAGAVTVPWASTLRSERRRCPNNQIYWEAIRWAIARGAREFDFGRSPIDSGTHRFKLGWGARERPLAWIRLDRDGRPLEWSSAADSALLQRFSRAWTHLPVSLATRIGPRIRCRIAS